MEMQITRWASREPFSVQSFRASHSLPAVNQFIEKMNDSIKKRSGLRAHVGLSVECKRTKMKVMGGRKVEEWRQFISLKGNFDWKKISNRKFSVDVSNFNLVSLLSFSAISTRQSIDRHFISSFSSFPAKRFAFARFHNPRQVGCDSWVYRRRCRSTHNAVAHKTDDKLTVLNEV